MFKQIIINEKTHSQMSAEDIAVHENNLARHRQNLESNPYLCFFQTKLPNLLGYSVENIWLKTFVLKMEWIQSLSNFIINDIQHDDRFNMTQLNSIKEFNLRLNNGNDFLSAAVLFETANFLINTYAIHLPFELSGEWEIKVKTNLNSNSGSEYTHEKLIEFLMHARNISLLSSEVYKNAILEINEKRDEVDGYLDDIAADERASESYVDPIALVRGKKRFKVLMSDEGMQSCCQLAFRLRTLLINCCPKIVTSDEIAYRIIVQLFSSIQLDISWDTLRKNCANLKVDEKEICSDYEGYFLNFGDITSSAADVSLQDMKENLRLSNVTSLSERYRS